MGFRPYGYLPVGDTCGLFIITSPVDDQGVWGTGYGAVGKKINIQMAYKVYSRIFALTLNTLTVYQDQLHLDAAHFDLLRK